MNFSSRWHFIRSFSTAILVAVFATPQIIALQAPEHLVSPSDLQKSAADGSRKRQLNLDTLNGALSSAEGKHALASAHLNSQRVEKAVAGLSDNELAQLASRAAKAQADFAAGSIGERELLIILLAIAVLIIVIAVR